MCSHTAAIAFKLDIIASYIRKTERKNSDHAFTSAVNFGKPKDAGKKSQSTTKRKGPANSKSKKVMKLADPDNENISFTNSNVGLVIFDILTELPKSFGKSMSWNLEVL